MSKSHGNLIVDLGFRRFSLASDIPDHEEDILRTFDDKSPFFDESVAGALVGSPIWNATNIFVRTHRVIDGDKGSASSSGLPYDRRF